MDLTPPDLRARLRPLRRTLSLGLFLELWPGWAVAGLLAAGLIVLGCRILAPAAAHVLYWSWLAPVVTAMPAVVLTWRRAYSPADLVAMADWLGGGRGMLMAVAETDDRAWRESPLVARASAYRLPRLRPWRALLPVAGAAVFLAAALAVPQRVPRAADSALANDIAAGLTTTVAELTQQKMVTPEEEKALEDAIDRIRLGAKQRVDAASWEAADALKEKLAADVAAKRDAVKWAQESLARYSAAAQAGGTGSPGAQAQAAELARALDKLAKSGLLAGAPESLRLQLKSGKLPTDPAALRELSASLDKYLRETNGRIGDLAKLGKEFGRFNADDFPLDSASGGDEPGSGGLDRGRADADLTWGKETSPFDRFKARALPPGAPRSPDDWAPLAELPGAPQAAPQAGVSAAERQYAAAAGQEAWRRGLAPRHQNVVKKYFAK